jgi:hypothetical protein
MQVAEGVETERATVFEPATFSLGTASGEKVAVRACSGTTGQVRDLQGDVPDGEGCWIW